MNRNRMASTFQGMDKLPADPDQTQTNTRFKVRVTERQRLAIRAIVWEGADMRQAGKTARLAPRSMRHAFNLPHVLEALNQEFAARRTSEPFRAYDRQVKLGEGATSEDVQERANRWIAGCDGLAPVTKVAIQAQVHHSFDGIGFAPRTVDATPDVVVDAGDKA